MNDLTNLGLNHLVKGDEHVVVAAFNNRDDAEAYAEECGFYYTDATPTKPTLEQFDDLPIGTIFRVEGDSESTWDRVKVSKDHYAYLDDSPVRNSAAMAPSTVNVRQANHFWGRTNANLKLIIVGGKS